MAGVHYIVSRDNVSALNSSESPEPVSFKCKAAYIQGNEISLDSLGFGFDTKPSITVDESGNIYVGGERTFEKGMVDEFNAEGCDVGELKAEKLVPAGLRKFSSPSGIAFDPVSDTLSISDSENEVVDEVTPSGEYLGRIAPPARSDTETGSEFHRLPLGVAVNSMGDLYVLTKLYRRNSAGQFSQQQDVVDVFGPGAFYPGVGTGGVINNQPNGEVTLEGYVR